MEIRKEDNIKVTNWLPNGNLHDVACPHCENNTTANYSNFFDKCNKCSLIYAIPIRGVV